MVIGSVNPMNFDCWDKNDFDSYCDGDWDEDLF